MMTDNMIALSFVIMYGVETLLLYQLCNISIMLSIPHPLESPSDKIPKYC